MGLLRHALVALSTIAAVAAQPWAIPFPAPLPNSRLVQTSHIGLPLELRSATADSEAILAATSYTRESYRVEGELPFDTFVTTYRDGLFAGGWKLIDSPKIDPRLPPPEGDLDITAH